MPDFYRIFDIVIQCDFPLPELPLVAGENGFRVEPGMTVGGESGMTPDRRPGLDPGSMLTEQWNPALSISVTMGNGDVSQFEKQGFQKTFEWHDYNDRAVCWCERRGGEYLYVFSYSATFHISPEGLISCYLHDDSTMQMLRHLLLNQIIPRYLATTGRLVLHAGAVTFESGKSVAFLGNSGFGKSTLVSSFHRNGAHLINDDCILLDFNEKGVTAIGGLVGIRLFPDSVTAVFSEAAGFTNYTPYTDKQQLFLKEEVAGTQNEPRVLDAMFLLNDPTERPAKTVCIEPIPGSEAMMAMIYSAFSLDPSDPKTTVSNFRNIGQAVTERLAVYRLQYPRDHERLAEVRLAVTECDALRDKGGYHTV